MKKPFVILPLFSLILLLIGLSSWAAPQQWTDLKGRKMTAEYVSASESTVVMRMSNGTERKLPINVFSKDSRTAISKMRNAAAPAPKIPEEQTVVPVPANRAAMTREERKKARKDGGGKKGSRRSGRAVLKTWEMPTFTLNLGSNGSALLSFKPKANEQARSPAAIQPMLYYKKGTKPTSKNFEKFVSEPKLRDDGATCHIQFSQDAQVIVHYKITKEKVMAWYELHEDDSVSFPTTDHALRVSIPTVAEWDLSVDGFHCAGFPEPLKHADLQRVFGKKAVVAKMLEGTIDRYPYPDKVEKGTFRGARSRIDFSPGVYGPRGVSFDGPAESATMRLHFYNGVTPLDGFRVVLQNDQPRPSSSRSAITITTP